MSNIGPFFAGATGELEGYASLLFEEIDGAKRRITLQGSEAPQGGPRRGSAFELGGKVRRAKKWEQGSQAPVIHITGTEENDLRVKVHFRETLIEPYAQGNSLARLAEIDSIRLAARPLRIVWGGVLRRGILREVVFGIESAGEIPTDLVFEIHDQGFNARGTRKAPLPRPLDTGLDELSDLLDSFSNAMNVSSGALGLPGISTDFAGQFNTAMAGLLAPLNQLLALGDDIKAGITDLRSGLAGAAAQAAAVFQRSRDMFAFLSSAGDPIEGDLADARAAWQRARADALVFLQQVSAKTFQIGVAAETQAQGVSSGRLYVVRGVETIESIARTQGTTVEAIRALNPTLSAGPLRMGTQVKLP